MNKLLGGRELARFEKNSCEDVRLTLHDWGVGRYLDIRVWSKIRPSDNAPSSPTEHGIVLDVELLSDLKRAIDKAIVALGDVEGQRGARPKDPEGQVPGQDVDEIGTSRAEGEKRRAETPTEARTPEGEAKGTGNSDAPTGGVQKENIT